MDRTLVELAIHGDEEAYAGLMAMAGDRLVAIAYRILRDLDRAEDAVQVALVNAWRDLPTLRDPDRFEAWLTRILVRSCYAEAGRSRRWNARLRVIPIDTPSPSDPMATVADRDRLDRGFRRLPTDQRAIVVLHHYLGWSQPEIAHALEIPLGTVKSRLFYATRALRAAIDADDRATSAERPA
ncbi:MAG TPA: RNA polymerase sigma factor [Candidatus Limnocylindrales bacterium]|nr:RNA polymerase sigma factor [Candidatus Limnocylindrales bacterium]